MQRSRRSLEAPPQRELAFHIPLVDSHGALNRMISSMLSGFGFVGPHLLVDPLKQPLKTPTQMVVLTLISEKLLTNIRSHLRVIDLLVKPPKIERMDVFGYPVSLSKV